jgi:zinc transporter 7
MAASFYASPLIGATTTLACFAHEIPHEIADYSILIRSGFTKKQAMQSQFLTAIGAFVGVSFPSSPHLLTPHRFPAPSLHVRKYCSPSTWRLSRLGESHHKGVRREAGVPICFIIRTFIGIAVHTATANEDAGRHSADLAAGVRQDATGLLGTTVQLSDLVSASPATVRTPWLISAQVIPFVAGGFLYIGAVAVLPTCVVRRPSVQRMPEFISLGYSRKARVGARLSGR